jgi:3-oxoacyl-(acyl-carrier-protein) synthase
VGGQSTEDTGFSDLYRFNRDRVHPLTIPRTMANAGASYISMEFGITGPAYTVSTACSSSNHAIGQAFWMVRGGHAELAITGGSEAPFSFGFLKAWEAMFSRERKGMILGEGGAMLVLEPLEAASARGASIYAEIVGFGMSSDANHITQPSAEGPARAIRSALRDAEVQADCVGYINAHGTGTPSNDCTETTAIRAVFGAHANQLAVSSTKSMHGHGLGAAGALEAAATALALRNGILPPTANFTEPDWTSFRIRPARQRRNTLFRTPLPSEDSTPSCFSEDLTASSAVLNQKVECTGASLDGLLSSFAGADANYIVHSRPYRQRRRREDLCLPTLADKRQRYYHGQLRWRQRSSSCRARKKN